jgi:signal transduction histidine kinase/CHASE2 domain-containing sensor protein
LRRIRSQVASTSLILLLSLAAAVAVTWLIPSLSAASVNMLFRFRGRVPPPDDIVIVAVDDASLQQVGAWPWPRSVMASALDRITSARPRAVGLDVVYAEPSDPTQDRLLAESIRRSGRVVLPAQLTEAESAQEDEGGPSSWLMPLPELKTAAAATGHAHADPDVDGVLRTVQLSKADVRGERLWAFGLETLRVSEGLPPEAIEERERSLRVGRYEIAVHNETERSSIPGVTLVRPNEMIINYLGPPRTFPYQSIADVLRGNVPASAFENKIVLVGAVAQTLGDTRITPYISYADGGRQGGVGMPGVEVHANIIETMRRGVWLTPRTDTAGFAVAFLVILCAAAFVRLLDGWRVVAGLGALLVLIVVGSLYVFNHYFIMPPLVPMLTGLFTVVPLLLLDNSVRASRDLDDKLDRLARIQKRFMPRRATTDANVAAIAKPSGLPHNVAWKLRAVDEITALLVARVGFMNQVFTSMTDGLLVADTAGRVVFANPAAQRFWEVAGADALAGRSLEELFVSRGVLGVEALREIMRGTLEGRGASAEVELSGREDRFYTLQFSAVLAGADPAQESESSGVGAQSSAEGGAEVVGLIVIITDVTKRRELERVKAETLQLVSHELRTPLTSIRALSDLLLNFPVPEGDSQESLRTIYSESVRMSDLINLYLDVTKIESGSQTLARDSVNANELIGECVRAFVRTASEKGIRISTKLEEPTPVLFADRQLLTQAFNNLIGNAIKYSPSDSEVEVGSSSDETHARVYVRDRGYGIPREFQARVFEKFYRLERDVKSEVVGTGLGLPLVKEIVERHGGHVTLESEPDKGSTFIIHMPLQKGS